MACKYQKLGRQMISPLILEGNAFATAVDNYQKYSGLNFWEDLLYYLQSGFVVSRPSVFAMFRPIDRDGKRGWFVQFACGSLGELVSCMPCPLAFVAFCRNNDSNMRVIEMDSFLKAVKRLYVVKRKT